MKKYFILFLIIGTTTLFASATMFGDGTTQSLSFNSEPNGAIVKIDGIKKCTTPCSIELKRNEFKTVEFIKDGYENGFINLKGDNITLAFWANALFIYSTTTDLINGAAYEYDKDNYFIELKKSETK